MTVFSCILVCLPEIHSKQEGGRTPAFGHTALILAIVQPPQMVDSQMREHTLIQAPYKQWRSGRVGWLYNNCLCGSHSCACACFFSGEGEVRSLLMLVCWPTSVSFIPAATEGAEPKRKKKKIRLISLTPSKSNRHYPTSPKARKYQLPSPATQSAQLSIPKYGQPTPAGLTANVARPGQATVRDNWRPICIHRTSHQKHDLT